MNVKLIAAVFLFSAFAWACTGSKDVMLDKEMEKSLAIESPYYQEIFPGTQDGVKAMILFLPCNGSLPGVKPDSVYFKGYHEVLVPYKSGKSQGYRARIMLNEEKENVTPPYPLEVNEALLLLQLEDGEKRYLRVANVAKGESVFMP